MANRRYRFEQRAATDLRLDLQLDCADELLVEWQQRRRASLVPPEPLEALVLASSLLLILHFLRPSTTLLAGRATPDSKGRSCHERTL